MKTLIQINRDRLQSLIIKWHNAVWRTQIYYGKLGPVGKEVWWVRWNITGHRADTKMLNRDGRWTYESGATTYFPTLELAQRTVRYCYPPPLTLRLISQIAKNMKNPKKDVKEGTYYPFKDLKESQQ